MTVVGRLQWLGDGGAGRRCRAAQAADAVQQGAVRPGGGQAAAQVEEEGRVEGEEGGDQPGPVLQHPHLACTTGQLNIMCLVHTSQYIWPP